MSQTKITTDRKTIRSWTEDRNGKPAMVSDTKDGEQGLIKLKFSDNDDLEEIDWDTFFDNFEDSKLALIYQEKTADGDTSTFNKLISRDSEQAQKLR